MNTSQYSDRPPLEWEHATDIKGETLGIRISRAKGTPRFSFAICGVSRDGMRLLSHFPVRWEVMGGAVTVTEPAIDVVALGNLIEQAKEWVAETLKKEGRHERRDFGNNREPQRKGKTERDRNRRRDHDRE